MWREGKVASFGLSTDAVLNRQRELRLALRFQASGLGEEQAGIAEVLAAYVDGTRFDEYERIVFLIESTYQQHVNNLAQDGGRYAARLCRRWATSRTGRRAPAC